MNKREKGDKIKVKVGESIRSQGDGDGHEEALFPWIFSSKLLLGLAP